MAVVTRTKAEAFVDSIKSIRDNVTDDIALQSISVYPEWEGLAKKSYVAEKAGFRFKYKDKLYKTINPNTHFATQWIPDEGTESLYVRIDEAHKGTLEDPIPYEGNMVLEKGKYYSQNDVVYLCNRDSGNAVYHALADLVGLYVEVVS